MKHTPTLEQIDLFKLCVTEYANLLNLRDWRIDVGDKPSAKGTMADVRMSMDDRLAIISIGSDWGKPITDTIVRETAVHEILHVFLKPLITASQSRDESAIATAEHSAIVVLEKLLAQ